MKKPLLWLLGLELAYWVPARLFVHYYHGGEIAKELIWTALRLASAVAVYLCFRKVIWPEGDKRHGKIDWVVMAAGAVFILVPALTQNLGMIYPNNVVFAITSLAVGQFDLTRLLRRFEYWLHVV